MLKRRRFRPPRSCGDPDRNRPAWHAAAGVRGRQETRAVAGSADRARRSGDRRNEPTILASDVFECWGRGKTLIELRGMSWDHPRGHDSVVATVAPYQALHPDISISWQTRSLQDFADYPVEKLAETFHLILDRPSIHRVHGRKWLLFAARRACRRRVHGGPGREQRRTESPQLPGKRPSVGVRYGRGVTGRVLPPGAAGTNRCRGAGKSRDTVVALAEGRKGKSRRLRCR